MEDKCVCSKEEREIMHQLGRACETCGRLREGVQPMTPEEEAKFYDDMRSKLKASTFVEIYAPDPS